MIEPIDSLDDPRLAPFVGLKEREAAREGLFIAEGLWIVRRLLDSPQQVVSILASPGRAEELAEQVGDRCPILQLPADQINKVLGFRFHSGVLACGQKPGAIGLSDLPGLADPGARVLLLVCPKIIAPANMGGLIRSAAAFGVGGVVLGPESCDPFYRLAIRISMGTVFKMPIYRSHDLTADLEQLAERYGVERVGTVLGDHALPLDQCSPGRRMAILAGAEDYGLTEQQQAACDRLITIPMAGGVDSLNVVVGTSLFLYWARRD